MFNAGAVAGEGFAAIAFVHGSIECGVCGGECGRHRQRVVKVGERRGGEVGAAGGVGGAVGYVWLGRQRNELQCASEGAFLAPPKTCLSG